MQIKIYWIGPTKNRPIRELCTDYVSRLRRMTSLEIVQIREPGGGPSRRDTEIVESEGREIGKVLPAGSRFVVLDAGGREFTSMEFSNWIGSMQNRGVRKLNFLVGGAAGIAQKVLDRAELRLSLGAMTWPHEIARMLLLEQIYRAYSILRNIPYHK